MAIQFVGTGHRLVSVLRLIAALTLHRTRDARTVERRREDVGGSCEHRLGRQIGAARIDDAEQQDGRLPRPDLADRLERGGAA